ncbi:MAG: methyltransferase domain-containing protein [Xanthobacteraceae bacterium]|nr:MAG: methyltransferase domain-containing protein [Xanthobacteraceae bacterium]
MDFTCNVCSGQVSTPEATLERETRSCPHCGSTVRMRSIVHLVSMSVLGDSRPLSRFQVRKDIVGLGMSDWDGYARPLAAKFSYVNTLFHAEPFFDVAQGAGTRAGTCDFVISTEVFEHVAPPVERAFACVFDLLKPGGKFIFTVPFTLQVETREHFPELFDYRIVQFDDEYVLVNRTRDGRFQLHDGLVFHGGPGTTLEMRLFCQSDLRDHLVRAGFTDICFYDTQVPEFGIYHKYPWSLPILATKPRV